MSRRRAVAGWPVGLAVLALIAVACAPLRPVTAPTPLSAPSPAAATPPSAAPATAAEPAAAPTSERSSIAKAGWKTNFGKHSVPLDEIRSGGVPRDGIAPIDRPKFEAVAVADRWLKGREPVVSFDLAGDARAYPLQLLIWHEIVNDTVGGVPVVVTFCPLCNSAIAFERTVDRTVLDFGTTGNLRNSDLVMWDRQTESWWQQITGEAIVGDLTGKRLKFLPASIVSWEEFKASLPNGTVLSRETGFSRDYGRNPYFGYDDPSSSPFLFEGRLDRRLPPMERVVAVSVGGDSAAYPFGVLARERVINDRVGGRAIAVFYAPGTASALDGASIADSRDVGATGVFVAAVDGRPLTFAADGNRIVDRETQTAWNVLGHATSGQLAGKRLEPVIHGDHFWFAIAAFSPQIRLYGR